MLVFVLYPSVLVMLGFVVFALPVLLFFLCCSLACTPPCWLCSASSCSPCRCCYSSRSYLYSWGASAGVLRGPPVRPGVLLRRALLLRRGAPLGLIGLAVVEVPAGRTRATSFHFILFLFGLLVQFWVYVGVGVLLLPVGVLAGVHRAVLPLPGVLLRRALPHIPRPALLVLVVWRVVVRRGLLLWWGWVTVGVVLAGLRRRSLLAAVFALVLAFFLALFFPWCGPLCTSGSWHSSSSSALVFLLAFFVFNLVLHTVFQVLFVFHFIYHVHTLFWA